MDQLNRLHATLSRVVQALEAAQVPFHCTGGIISSLYGEPRLTQDIDVVIRIDKAPDLTRVLKELHGPFFVDDLAARAALRDQRMFQALDRDTFIKVDLHVGEDIPGELDRTVRAEVIPGLTVPVVTREDAILSKLLWIRQGSGKSRQDVKGMLLRSGQLDWNYLNAVARSLGVEDLLQSFREELR